MLVVLYHYNTISNVAQSATLGLCFIKLRLFLLEPNLVHFWYWSTIFIYYCSTYACYIPVYAVFIYWLCLLLILQST